MSSRTITEAILLEWTQLTFVELLKSSFLLESSADDIAQNDNECFVN